MNQNTKCASVGLSVLAVSIGLALLAVTYVRHARLERQCVENLELIHAAMVQYQASNEGRFPAWPGTPGQMMFPAEQILQYINDPAIFISPRSMQLAFRQKIVTTEPNSVIDDTDYFYIGYVFANERSMQEWLEVCHEQIPQGKSIPEVVDDFWPEYEADIEKRRVALMQKF